VGRLICGIRQSLDAAFEVFREFQAGSGHQDDSMF
jgi:hypothetical protein